MVRESASKRVPAVLRSLLINVALPGLGFGVAVCFALGYVGVTPFVTGLAMAGALAALWGADRLLLQPRLKRLRRDWVRFGLENAFSMLEHLVGPLLALVLCGYIFGFSVQVNTAFAALIGILIGFPIIHGTSSALNFYRQMAEKERREERLRALATQAELKALKAQINPHFLFNALNTIAELTHTDPTCAEATVERLAEMFRHVLSGSERGRVPLEEELAFLEVYLEIERARFGERLHVTYEVSPEVVEVPVPSLILQPLVENAIRHGHGRDGSICLTIRVQSCNGEVVIAIADQGPGMPPGHKIGKGSGHGLRNVDERLRKTYGEGYGLKVKPNGQRGTIVEVTIPVGDRL
jgi:signal transduction histidine kinase